MYDFCCVPHEHAGGLSVGAGEEPVPEIALRALPPVDEIMRLGVVKRS